MEAGTIIAGAKGVLEVGKGAYAGWRWYEKWRMGTGNDAQTPTFSRTGNDAQTPTFSRTKRRRTEAETGLEPIVAELSVPKSGCLELGVAISVANPQRCF
jgi:hypothetical protein